MQDDILLYKEEIQMKKEFSSKSDFDVLKRNCQLYIFQAMFEYLIIIIISGSFLATITRELGISDSLTGILSAVTSMGGLFQLLSIALRKVKVKRFVIMLSVINQLFFMFLYVIPLVNIGKCIKTALFAVFICLAYILYNIANPKKMNWLMSSVEDAQRGIFTAKKEMFSLVAEMLFSFLMGAVIDKLSELGKTREAFIVSAAVIFVLMVFNTLMLWFTEKPTEINEWEQKKAFGADFKNLITDKSVLKITGVLVLYNISSYASVPFYGSYQINELGLSLKTISVLVIIGNISRLLVSRFWGRYADKNSFAVMVEKCFLFLALAQLCALFAVPSNGKVMFALYYFFFGIAMGGISSSTINLIFDYVDSEKISDSFAITQAVSGLVGFLSTVILSTLVSFVKANGNSIFGINAYAQQICSLISLLVTVSLVIYLKKVIFPLNRKEKT